MPCEAAQQSTSQYEQDQREKEIQEALEELEKALKAGKIKAVKDPSGRVTFQGWSKEARKGLCDACTYRRLVAKRSMALEWALTQRNKARATR